MQNDSSVKAALEVMKAHIDALNARDEEAIAATLHFPHFRMSGSHLKVWESPDTYFADFRDRAGQNWSRSQFSDIRTISASDEKVHLDVKVLRFDKQGTEIARFRSLWIVTFENGRWAAKFRSSFASR